MYFEETGSGIPILLQHTAGADGRQWRLLLEDPELRQHFRMLAYDLPYHARSLPPTTVAWWQEEYRLTRDFFMQVPLRLVRELGLDRPVFMGCSIDHGAAGPGQGSLTRGASIYPAVQNLLLAARALGLGTVLTPLRARDVDARDGCHCQRSSFTRGGARAIHR